MKGFSGVLGKIINVLFLIMMLWICAIAMFGSGLEIPDWVRKTFLLPNFVLALIGVAAVFILAWATRRQKGSVFWLAVLFWTIQVFVTFFYFYLKYCMAFLFKK